MHTPLCVCCRYVYLVHICTESIITDRSSCVIFCSYSNFTVHGLLMVQIPQSCPENPSEYILTCLFGIFLL